MEVHLGDEEFELLDNAHRATGASRAELIRRAIRARYARYASPSVRSPEERLARLRTARGIWADRPFTTEEYIDAVRHGKRLPDE